MLAAVAKCLCNLHSFSAAQPAQADLIRDLVKGYVRPVSFEAASMHPLSVVAVSSMSFSCNPVLPLRGAEVMTKPGTMMQEVAADQAIMQLMDARGTLMELKVILLYKAADMHLLLTAFEATAMHPMTTRLHN